MKRIYLLFLLFNFYLLYSSPFIEFYKKNFTAEELKTLYLNKLDIREDYCLASVEDTVKILDEKYDIHIKKKDVTRNLRFIVGDCDPIILVPGIFSVKLHTQIDCKGLYENEKHNYENLKFFCLSKPCINIEKYEEYRIFLEAGGPFGFFESLNDLNLYNACFSYFMTIFNGNECPARENICTKSDYIKVMFYGGTNDTIANSKCGLEASRDVLFTSKFISNAVKGSKVYGDIIDSLKYIGYEPGFSLGGVPNDFRKFVATNSFATNVFRYLIESFYNYTGKKVVIFAHSFGNLIALHNLVSEENKDLLPKIKKFVAIGPPFAGATKLLTGYLHGLKDFDHILSSFHPFGQSLLFKSVPTATELRPLPIFSKLLKNPEYKEFIEAINERLTLEKKYINDNYDYNTMGKMTENFDRIYSSYFPSLSNEVCKEKYFIENKLQMKCLTNIYNIFDCPMIVTLDNLNDKKDIEYYCNKRDDNLYYVNEIGQERKSIEELLTKGKFTYGLPEMETLINKFNKNYKEYNLDKKIDISNFETEEEFRKENLLQIEYYKNISLIQDLPIPPIDTDIIYTSAIDTNTGEFIRKNSLSEEGDNIIGGGDGTVSTWSSLLVGLKWIYDKQKNNLAQRIRLIEYCSRLKDDFPLKEDSNFIALGCKCLNEKNLYDNEFDKCNHQKMLLDEYLIKFLHKITSKGSNITEDRIKAAKAVLENKDYSKICDDQLFIFAKSFNRTMNIDHSTRNNIIWVIFIIGAIITLVFYFCCAFFACFACKRCRCVKCCCCLCRNKCIYLQTCYCSGYCVCDDCDDCCCWKITDDNKGCLLCDLIERTTNKNTDANNNTKTDTKKSDNNSEKEMQNCGPVLPSTDKDAKTKQTSSTSQGA